MKPRAKRLLWFVGLHLSSVAALLAFTMALKTLLRVLG